MEDPSAKQVHEAINWFMEAVRSRDIKALEKVVAHEPGIVFYGSQEGDKQTGWPAVKASFEEQFSEVSEIKTEILDSKVSVVGDLAWAAYDLRYGEVGSPGGGSFESRWTCVLRRYQDGWKYVHMHHSRGR
jgi:ketosteroid isomerase-like protein